MLILIYLTFIATVFYWQVKKVKAGECTKGKAIVLHAAYTMVPVVLYGVVFMVLVGIEEFTDIAIIGEGYARSLPIVIIGGVVVSFLATLVFSLVVLAMKRRDINAT